MTPSGHIIEAIAYDNFAKQERDRGVRPNRDRWADLPEHRRERFIDEAAAQYDRSRGFRRVLL